MPLSTQRKTQSNRSSKPLRRPRATRNASRATTSTGILGLSQMTQTMKSAVLDTRKPSVADNAETDIVDDTGSNDEWSDIEDPGQAGRIAAFEKLVREAQAKKNDDRGHNTPYSSIPPLIKARFDSTDGRLFSRHMVAYFVQFGDRAWKSYEDFGRRQYLEAMNHWYTRALDLIPDSSAPDLKGLPLLRLCMAQHLVVAAGDPEGSPKILDKAIIGLLECESILHKYGIYGGTPSFPYPLNLAMELADVQSELGSAYLTRYRLCSKYSDLQASIKRNEAAVSCRTIRSTATQHALRLHKLSISYRTLYEYDGDFENLRESITACKNALHMLPDDARALYRAMISKTYAESLTASAESRMDLLCARRALDLLHGALAMLPMIHGDEQFWLRCSYHISIGHSIMVIYGLSMETTLLDNALYHFRIALNYQKWSRWDLVSGWAPTDTDIAVILLQRFTRQGNSHDIEDAIRHLESAQRMAKNETSHVLSYILDNLGVAFRLRFSTTNTIRDIGQSLVYHREALVYSQHPSSPRHRAVLFSNLAMALLAHHRVSANPEYLEEAISKLDEARSLIPGEHPLLVPLRCSLSLALSRRYQSLKKKEDLDVALELSAQVKSLPETHTSFIDQASIRCSILQQSALAVSSYDQAVEAVDLSRKLIQNVDQNHHKWHVFAGELSDSLMAVHSLGGNAITTETLDEIVNLRASALQNLKPRDPEYVQYLKGLADAFITRHRAFPNAFDLECAVARYAEASRCETGSLSVRFKAATSWVNVCRHDDPDYSNRMEALETAVELMTQMSSMELAAGSRVIQLAMHDIGIASTAARCAIEMNKLERAVELLEKGRGLFWRQALGPWPLVAKAKDLSPDLAKRMDAVLRRLSTLEGHHPFSDRSKDLSPQALLSLEKASLERGELSKEWDGLVVEAREFSNGDSLMDDDTFTTLKYSATHGPAILLNVTVDGSDALIIHNHPLGEISRIPLDLGFKDAEDMATAFSGIVKIWTGKEHRGTCLFEDPSVDDEAQEILRNLWNLVVKPVLLVLGLDKSTTEKPRVWWIPTGPLASLPLHAAGLYNGTEESDDISQYLTFSYSTTLKSIIPSTTLTSSVNHSGPQMLAVAVPETDWSSGTQSIPGTLDEVDSIKSVVPGSCLRVMSGGEATVQNITASLPQYSILHFACHGEHSNDPLRGSLLLADDRMYFAQIMGNVPQSASLVVLSACSTAMGDPLLTDEGLHLAGAFMGIGYPSAVATLWPIDDSDARVVFTHFYKALVVDGELRAEGAAEALRTAVVTLRESPNVGFERWLPFIHIGR